MKKKKVNYPKNKDLYSTKDLDKILADFKKTNEKSLRQNYYDAVVFGESSCTTFPCSCGNVIFLNGIHKEIECPVCRVITIIGK